MTLRRHHCCFHHRCAVVLATLFVLAALGWTVWDVLDREGLLPVSPIESQGAVLDSKKKPSKERRLWLMSEAEEQLSTLREQRFSLCDMIQRKIYAAGSSPSASTAAATSSSSTPTTTMVNSKTNRTAGVTMYFIGDSTALQNFRAATATATRCMLTFARRKNDLRWIEAAEQLAATNRALLIQTTNRVTLVSPSVTACGWRDPSASHAVLRLEFVRALYAEDAAAAVEDVSKRSCGVPLVISVHVGTWDLLRPTLEKNGFLFDRDYVRDADAWRGVLHKLSASFAVFVRRVARQASRCRAIQYVLAAIPHPNCSAPKFSRLKSSDDAATSSDPYRYLQRDACEELVVRGSWRMLRGALMSQAHHPAKVLDVDALVWLHRRCSMSDGAHLDAEADEFGNAADSDDIHRKICRLYSQTALWRLLPL